MNFPMRFRRWAMQEETSPPASESVRAATAKKAHTMIVSATHDKDSFWHIWYIRPGLNRDDAHQEFLKRKPRDYIFDKFFYDHVTGRVRTL